MSNLSLRIIYGAIYVAILVFSVIYGSPIFGIVIALVAFLSLNEMGVLSKKSTSQHLWLNPALFAGVIIYLTFFGARKLDIVTYSLFWIVQLICIYLIYRQLKLQHKLNYLLSTVYLVLPLLALAIWYIQTEAMATEYVLFYLISIWLYDSMAYVVGKQLGKTPIFPNVSPKKTVEGSVGGALVTVLLMIIINHYWLFIPVKVYWLTAVVVFFATFGDFVESYMKRRLGIKDSGTLIPGHGGILDRMDSIYLSALPYIVILLLL